MDPIERAARIRKRAKKYAEQGNQTAFHKLMTLAAEAHTIRPE